MVLHQSDILSPTGCPPLVLRADSVRAYSYIYVYIGAALDSVSADKGVPPVEGTVIQLALLRILKFGLTLPSLPIVYTSHLRHTLSAVRIADKDLSQFFACLEPLLCSCLSPRTSVPPCAAPHP